MKKYAIAVCAACAVAIILLSFFTALNRNVVWEAEGAQITECGDIESINENYDCILVFGAGIKNNSRPSDMLADRLRGAIELYKLGTAEKIILSGDCSGEDYDEVSVMVNYCVEQGIPKEALIRDDRGFSTYETVYNAVCERGYKSIILVTQRYHIYRALYIARQMGADADGLTADYRAYALQTKRDVREYFARVKDFFQLTLS